MENKIIKIQKLEKNVLKSNSDLPMQDLLREQRTEKKSKVVHYNR